MEIVKLRLYTTCLEAQWHFYVDHLGFELKSEGNDHFSIVAGKTELEFQRSGRSQPGYHFAFLIPHPLIDGAVEFVIDKGIAILSYKGSKTIDFGNGKSVYFYDKGNNIVEFIQRPSLGFTSTGPFSVSQVLKVNEIGLPAENTLEMSRLLIDQYQIQLIDPANLSERFCWIGDFNGAFIVTKIGRKWLPTDMPGGINDFCIEFLTKANMPNSICLENNTIGSWHLHK